MSEAADETQARARTTIERLRALLARGKTLAEAGAQIGTSKSSAQRLAARHRLPRRQRGLPRHKSQRIVQYLRQLRSINEIARRVKVSTKTVWMRKIALDGPGPRPCRPYWCKCGFRVNLKPCQICLLRARRESAQAGNGK